MRAGAAELQARMRFVHSLLDETDAICRGAFEGALSINAKPDRTLVTHVDTQVELWIRERLADAYPGDAFLGEEFGGAAAAAQTRWIVDPIDATHNFVRGIGVFATLLAFERDGQLELGVASAPALGQRWFALRGGGAFVRGSRGERPLHVSTIDRLDRAQLLYSSIEIHGQDHGLLPALARDAWRSRGFGDFWGHVLVAAGSAEIMLEADLKPWDLAAPAIIVSEAGGRVTDFAGVDTWLGPQALSTNGLIHDEVLARLHGS